MTQRELRPPLRLNDGRTGTGSSSSVQMSRRRFKSWTVAPTTSLGGEENNSYSRLIRLLPHGWRRFLCGDGRGGGRVPHHEDDREKMPLVSTTQRRKKPFFIRVAKTHSHCCSPSFHPSIHPSINQSSSSRFHRLVAYLLLPASLGV